VEDPVAKPPKPRVGDLLRLPVGAVDLAGIDPRATPGAPGGKATTAKALPALAAQLEEGQEKLYAAGKEGSPHRLLLVLQGMDTCGKGGTVRHVIGAMNPQGCQVVAFGRPTAEERRHDFLWRIRQALPGPGMVGILDRSHYEDVLAVRVHDLAPKATWSRRYGSINRFEQQLADDGVRVVKVFLHISPEEQKQRLLARLDDPTKHWKYNPRDVDERALWPRYQQAYADALERCTTAAAPWYVVPADRKWYRNWAVSALLVEQLTELAPAYPPTDFDVAAERARVEAS
jgi:PPK2 family polyphosphate:nucleotide phosphotransferase